MRRFLAFVAACALALGSTAAVSAARPSSETFDIDFSVVDTQLCVGFDVTIDGTGHVRVSTHFDRDGDPVMEINNIAIHRSYSANGNTVNVVDTGVDFVSFLDDGSVTVAVTGMVQLVTAGGQGVVGGETGRLLFHISSTGEFTVISEHGKRAGDPAAAICELLAAA
jgi:L-cysteine desulfidase